MSNPNNHWRLVLLLMMARRTADGTISRRENSARAPIPASLLGRGSWVLPSAGVGSPADPRGVMNPIRLEVDEGSGIIFPPTFCQSSFFFFATTTTDNNTVVVGHQCRFFDLVVQLVLMTMMIGRKQYWETY
jgi:hypothetical protein